MPVPVSIDAFMRARSVRRLVHSVTPSGRPDAARSRMRGLVAGQRMLLWLLVAAAMAVLAGSAVVITRLQQDVQRHHELRMLLTQMKVAAWQQGTLRSQALLAGELSPALAHTRDQVDSTVDAIGGRFTLHDPASVPAEAVQAAYLAYDEAVDEEFDLLEQGQTRAAEEVDASRSAPAFAHLLIALDAADRHYRDTAGRAADRARTGTLLALALSGGIIIALTWQSHRIRARAFRRAAHQRSHDALTGLPNRVLLHEHTTTAIAHAQHEQTGAALLLIDLDRFKEINDTLGHHYGDQLLIQAAERIRQAVRADDTVARLGGDEFAVLLPYIAGAHDVAAAAARLHDALQQPFELGGLSLTVAGSIGAAIHPDHGATADELLQHADIAMYTAKTRHTGYTLFDAAQDHADPRKLTLASDLRRGIDQGQLVLHYQPKVDTQTGTVLGAEALVRWQHPQHGLIPPDEFITLAEQTGLITPLTRFVLDTAVRQCRTWLDTGHRLSVAVNVSTHRLLDLDFPAEVADRLTHWRLPAANLTLEITESAIMTDPDRALHVVQQLHDLGVHLSIDDFGTGYSSMAYLKNLPVQELKIDRTFVTAMTSNDRDAIIVRSTAELGHHLGLRVIAEGVEDAATWHQLNALGCDAIQGYYVSRPITADQFQQWLDHHDTRTSTGPAAPRTA
jgi:diguanylate cyclase (GGDEF)-like protein